MGHPRLDRRRLKTRLFDLRKAGFNRLYQAGEVFEFSTPESLLDINFAEPVFVLVDRLVVSAEARTRIVDAIETAYREAGEVIFEMPVRGERRSSGRECPPTRTPHCGFRSGLSARIATCGMRSRSRGCFLLTILMGLARGARGLETRSISISIW